MFIGVLAIILLFYFFAILQGSFFTHFGLFGMIPNLVFILFFLLIFFDAREGRNKINFEAIIYAVIAGLFLDIFSSTYLGVSVVLLIIIGFLVKKMKTSLSEKQDKQPMIYFLSLFLFWDAVYEALLMVYLRFLDPAHVQIILDWRFFAGLIYNLFFATIGFFVFKKIVSSDINNRQLKLFR